MPSALPAHPRNPNHSSSKSAPAPSGISTGSLRLTEEIAGIAARNGRDCVVLRPTGRGPGSVYQNYGEVDVLEAIEAVARRYAIDRDRITVTGASMGGVAAWYLISHYPDLFAGAAPFCGYCDYRLWEKPGGLTFHLQDWEEPSWRARSAAFRVENLRHTPVWIVHGEWDRGVGGGVPVAHSRQMAERLDALGFEFEYTEVPATGHACRLDDIWEQVILWLLARSKKRHPDIVSPRHLRSAAQPLALGGHRAAGSIRAVRLRRRQTGRRGDLGDGRRCAHLDAGSLAAGRLRAVNGQACGKSAGGGNEDLSTGHERQLDPDYSR